MAKLVTDSDVRHKCQLVNKAVKIFLLNNKSSNLPFDFPRIINSTKHVIKDN